MAQMIPCSTVIMIIYDKRAVLYPREILDMNLGVKVNTKHKWNSVLDNANKLAESFLAGNVEKKC